MDYSDLSIGKILLAKPFVLDPNFRRSVILLCEHEEESGSMGFILNKHLDIKLQDLVDDFPDFDTKVYYGGPVATNTLHFMHSVGDLMEVTEEVQNGVYWGGDFSKLKFLIKSKLVTPNDIKFFLGYSGWSAGQLKGEIKNNSWYIGDGDPNYLFSVKSRRLWNTAMKNKGDIFSVLAEMPDSNILN